MQFQMSARGKMLKNSLKVITQIRIWWGASEEPVCAPLLNEDEQSAQCACACSERWSLQMEKQAQFHAKMGPKKPLAPVESLGARKLTHRQHHTQKRLTLIKNGIVLPLSLHWLDSWKKKKAVRFIYKRSGMHPHTHAHFVSISLAKLLLENVQICKCNMFLLPNQCNHIWNSASACLRWFSCFWGCLVTWVLWAAATFGISGEKKSSAKHPCPGMWFNLRGCCCWE